MADKRLLVIVTHLIGVAYGAEYEGKVLVRKKEVVFHWIYTTVHGQPCCRPLCNSWKLRATSQHLTATGVPLKHEQPPRPLRAHRCSASILFTTPCVSSTAMPEPSTSTKQRHIRTVGSTHDTHRLACEIRLDTSSRPMSTSNTSRPTVQVAPGPFNVIQGLMYPRIWSQSRTHQGNAFMYVSGNFVVDYLKLNTNAIVVLEKLNVAVLSFTTGVGCRALQHRP